MQPDMLTRTTDDKRTLLVLATTPFGMLGFRCQPRKFGEEWCIDLTSTVEDCVTFEYVIDVNKWKCFQVVPRCPPPTAGDGGSHIFQLMVVGAPQKLLSFSVRLGLPNLTVFYLKKLFKHLDVAVVGPKPTTEAPLVQALALHILGDEANAGLLKAIAIARTVDADELASTIADSPLLHGDVSAVLSDEIEDLELQEEIAEIKRKQKASAARREARMKAIEEAGIGDWHAPPPPPKHLRLLVWPVGGFTQAEARGFCPPTWHARWKIQSLLLGQRSKSFDLAVEEADNKALCFVLRLAWAKQCTHFEEDCPFYFGDEVEIALQHSRIDTFFDCDM